MSDKKTQLPELAPEDIPPPPKKKVEFPFQCNDTVKQAAKTDLAARNLLREAVVEMDAILQLKADIPSLWEQEHPELSEYLRGSSAYEYRNVANQVIKKPEKGSK